MKILIMGGFLGSGKTSIVLQMARHVIGGDTDKAAKVVIIENEIGEISVDDKLLRGKGYEVSTIFSGCVCCSMSGDLVIGLMDIKKKYDPELLILEATGVAYPQNIREIIAHSMPQEIIYVTCVTDAKRWLRLVRPMEMLLKDQLDSADVILINKVDLIDEIVLAETEVSVKSYNGTAKYFKISASKPIDPRIFDIMIGNAKGEAYEQ